MSTSAALRRVALYGRVSTSDQDVGSQLARLRSFIDGAATDTTRGPVEYVDDGVSGSLDSRPAFDRLRDEIRADGFDVVVAAKLDRLGRSARSVLDFFNLCEQHAVRVVLVDQAIDTATPAGRLLRTVMAAVAEFEADIIRERTRDAMAAFKAGTRVPKGRVGRKPVVTPELVAQIRALRDERGLQWSAIARTVHHPSSSCRKWYSAARAGKPRVINGSGEFPPPSDEQGALLSAPNGTDSSRP